MLSGKQVLDGLRDQQRRHTARDGRWENVRAARRGDLSEVAPDMFSDEIPKPIVANFIDTVARDLAELIAPLPSFNCQSASMASDAARKFADRRTKIVQNYLLQSKLDRQMLSGADHFNTYATTVFYIEPDFETKTPHITIEDPTSGYADVDRWGRIRAYYKRWYHDAHVLANMFPDYASVIDEASKSDVYGPSGNLVEIVRYCDADQIAIVLICKEPCVLVSGRNPLGETPVVMAKRPWLHEDEYRGQFDDAIWVQIAKDALARLNLEAVEKSVQAPIALPADVMEYAMGPDSIIRSNSPDKIRRVGLDLPQGAFAEAQVLMDELRVGTRYPAARSGQSNASVITGRGVQSLMGGFETQITAAQMAFRDAFMDVIRLCFKMDEKYWPNAVKSIRGNSEGTPYEVKYKPSVDIKGDTTVAVEYGFAAGMDPNRAVVMLLQLRAERAFSRDFFVRQLPFPINITEEQSKVDVEQTRESIMQGIAGYVQSIPALAQQGMDPTGPVLKAAMIVKGLQKGGSIEDVVMEAFAPQPPNPATSPPGQPPGMGAPPGGGGPGGGGTGGGLMESGLMQGVAPGQAGQAPGARPDIQTMLAGLTAAGKPNMSAATRRTHRI